MMDGDWITHAIRASADDRGPPRDYGGTADVVFADPSANWEDVKLFADGWGSMFYRGDGSIQPSLLAPDRVYRIIGKLTVDLVTKNINNTLAVFQGTCVYTMGRLIDHLVDDVTLFCDLHGVPPDPLVWKLASIAPDRSYLYGHALVRHLASDRNLVMGLMDGTLDRDTEAERPREIPFTAVLNLDRIRHKITNGV